MQYFLELISYPFALRALCVGALLSLCAALLGVNLVLKRMSMLGDGLSHVSFGAAAIALAAGVAPLEFSIPLVIIAAFLLLWLQNKNIGGDAAIAVISSGALAIGITVASLTTGMNTDISSYMFGSILALSKRDVTLSIACAIAVMVVYLLFYHKIFLCAFDPDFARATGVRVKLYDGITAVLTAVLTVIGMRVMGALLISSIITVPALSAMRCTKSYRGTVLCAAAFSVTAFFAGITLSFIYDLPTGAAVVLCNLVVFAVSSAVRKTKSR